MINYVTSVRDERLDRTGGSVLRPTLAQAYTDTNTTTTQSCLVLMCYKCRSVSNYFILFLNLDFVHEMSRRQEARDEIREDGVTVENPETV